VKPAPWLLTALCVSSTGCLGLTPSPEAPLSWGSSNDGLLFDGVAIADRGEGFVRARPREDTRWATPQMARALERAAASVARTYPGGAPLRVGDLSYEQGGQHPRHRSHRSGRDADVIFYVTDAAGQSTRGRGWLAFDRFGVSRETVAPGDAEPSGDLFFLDDARNWHLVRTLLLDPEANVQWIFCSRGVKSRLLAYAIAHEPNAEAIFRAAWVLHQPSSGNPHADHFHIRVACTAEELALGCWDNGPIWPWMRRDIEKPAGVAETLDDATLVQALLSDPPEGDREVADAPSGAGGSG
jgi:penicillin-insensitive murein endopeptidase